MPAHSFIAVGLFALQFSTFVLVLGFTQAASFWRIALLPFYVFIPYLQLPHLETISYAPARGVLGGAAVFTVVLYIDTALIHKFSYRAQGPTSPVGGLKPAAEEREKIVAVRRWHNEDAAVEFLRRLYFGLTVAAGARFAGTKWRVNNIPHFSRNDPAYIPSKSQFICERAPKVLFAWFLLLSLNFMPQDDDKQVSFSAQRIPLLCRLGTVEKKEIYTRIGTVLAYWLVQYILHIAVHGSMAMIAVALDFKVAAWPPLFGAARDCYSLRRFWG